MSSPGDMLGDLSAALGRRRKAMSGKDKPREREEKKEHNLGGGSMMDNISKMIPSPMNADASDNDDNSIEGSGAW